jgi:hypothetical protein
MLEAGQNELAAARQHAGDRPQGYIWAPRTPRRIFVPNAFPPHVREEWGACPALPHTAFRMDWLP